MKEHKVSLKMSARKGQTDSEQLWEEVSRSIQSGLGPKETFLIYVKAILSKMPNFSELVGIIRHTII